MYNGFSKKDFLRMYNVNRTIFHNWCKEIKTNINIKDTKQTFTPKEIKIIISSFGQPPFSTEQEKEYIKAIFEQF